MGARQVPQKPLLPEEVQYLVNEAYHEGYQAAVRNYANRDQSAHVDLKAVQRVLWALAHEAGGTLKVSQKALDDAPMNASLATTTDPMTSELFIHAREPNHGKS